MLENKQEILKPILAAGVISTLGAAVFGALKYDQHLGEMDAASSVPSDPEMFIHKNPDARRAFVLLGGFCMGTKGVSKRFASQLADDVSMFAPIAPNAGFSPKAMYEKTYQELENMDDIEELNILGLSMGGRLEIGFVNYGVSTGREHLLSNYTAGFSRTPMSKQNIRPMPRFGLNAIGKFRYSRAFHQARKRLASDTVKSLSSAPTSRVVEEAAFLLSDRDTTLHAKPRRVLWFRGMQPCPVTNEDASISVFQRANHIAVEQYFDSNCTERQHMPTSKKAAWFMLNRFGIAKPEAEAKVITLPTLTVQQPAVA